MKSHHLLNLQQKSKILKVIQHDDIVELLSAPDKSGDFYDILNSNDLNNSLISETEDQLAEFYNGPSETSDKLENEVPASTEDGNRFIFFSIQIPVIMNAVQ